MNRDTTLVCAATRPTVARTRLQVFNDMVSGEVRWRRKIFRLEVKRRGSAALIFFPLKTRTPVLRVQGPFRV
jgi:hypothetical protein